MINILHLTTKMDKKVLVVWSCVVLFALLISPSQGKFCTKLWHYYTVQNYCTNYSWWHMWCWSTAYRRIVVYERGNLCCPGFKGSDCSTPICQTPCEPGYVCTSPDECTVDPNFIASVNSDISNSTDTLNNTITYSTESSESTKPSGSIESGTELGESTIEPNLEYSESTESSTEPSIEVN